MTASDSFPLKWPVGRPRTNNWHRVSSAFKTSMARSRDSMLRELKLLGATHIVISSNVETYMRGGQQIPYADQSKQKDDPGVAVYYMWKGEQYCLSCDKYKSVMDNLQAINKTVEAIRGINRWGTGEMMKAAFQGFKELPPAPTPPPKIKSAWEVIGVPLRASKEEIKRAYYEKAKVMHPDKGGVVSDWLELQNAYSLIGT